MSSGSVTGRVDSPHAFGLGLAPGGVLGRELGADVRAAPREAVLGCATACSMPEDRTVDVMLAVHELAANAVHHGPGHGRPRIHLADSTLHCEVSDLDRPAWES